MTPTRFMKFCQVAGLQKHDTDQIHEILPSRRVTKTQHRPDSGNPTKSPGHKNTTPTRFRKSYKVAGRLHENRRVTKTRHRPDSRNSAKSLGSQKHNTDQIQEILPSRRSTVIRIAGSQKHTTPTLSGRLTRERKSVHFEASGRPVALFRRG